MKIYPNSDLDYLSIDFKDEVESKSEYNDGIIVRYDKKGHVIGIDITVSMKLFYFSWVSSLCDQGSPWQEVKRRLISK